MSTSVRHSKTERPMSNEKDNLNCHPKIRILLIKTIIQFDILQQDA